jgi:hypothetical protein
MLKPNYGVVSPVEKGVGPDGDASKGHSDRGIVDEKLVVHHLQQRKVCFEKKFRAFIFK